MNKYGRFNCYDWFESLCPETKFISAVESFCLDGYQSFIRRKTITPEEREAIKGLREMLELIETHASKIENKGE